MPNMFGGEQTHPEYKSRELMENEVLVDSVLYTISINKENIEITYKNVDGTGGKTLIENAPEEVKNRVKKLQL